MYSCNGLGLMDFTVPSLSHVGAASCIRHRLPRVSPPPRCHCARCGRPDRIPPPKATCSDPATQRQSRGPRAWPNVLSPAGHPSLVSPVSFPLSLLCGSGESRVFLGILRQRGHRGICPPTGGPEPEPGPRLATGDAVTRPRRSWRGMALDPPGLSGMTSPPSSLARCRVSANEGAPGRQHPPRWAEGLPRTERPPHSPHPAAEDGL